MILVKGLLQLNELSVILVHVKQIQDMMETDTAARVCRSKENRTVTFPCVIAARSGTGQNLKENPLTADTSVTTDPTDTLRLLSNDEEECLPLSVKPELKFSDQREKCGVTHPKKINLRSIAFASFNHIKRLPSDINRRMTNSIIFQVSQDIKTGENTEIKQTDTQTNLNKLSEKSGSEKSIRETDRKIADDEKKESTSDIDTKKQGCFGRLCGRCCSKQKAKDKDRKKDRNIKTLKPITDEKAKEKSVSAEPIRSKSEINKEEQPKLEESSKVNYTKGYGPKGDDLENSSVSIGRGEYAGRHPVAPVTKLDTSIREWTNKRSPQPSVNTILIERNDSKQENLHSIREENVLVSGETSQDPGKSIKQVEESLNDFDKHQDSHLEEDKGKRTIERERSTEIRDTGAERQSGNGSRIGTEKTSELHAQCCCCGLSLTENLECRQKETHSMSTEDVLLKKAQDPKVDSQSIHDSVLRDDINQGSDSLGTKQSTEKRDTTVEGKTGNESRKWEKKFSAQPSQKESFTEEKDSRKSSSPGSVVSASIEHMISNVINSTHFAKGSVSIEGNVSSEKSRSPERKSEKETRKLTNKASTEPSQEESYTKSDYSRQKTSLERSISMSTEDVLLKKAQDTKVDSKSIHDSVVRDDNMKCVCLAKKQFMETRDTTVDRETGNDSRKWEKKISSQSSEKESFTEEKGSRKSSSPGSVVAASIENMISKVIDSNLSRKKTSYSEHSAALEQMVLQIAERISLRNKTSPESVVSDSLEDILSKITQWKRSRTKTVSDDKRDSVSTHKSAVLDEIGEESDSIDRRFIEIRGTGAQRQSGNCSRIGMKETSAIPAQCCRCVSSLTERMDSRQKTFLESSISLSTKDVLLKQAEDSNIEPLLIHDSVVHDDLNQGCDCIEGKQSTEKHDTTEDRKTEIDSRKSAKKSFAQSSEKESFTEEKYSRKCSSPGSVISASIEHMISKIIDSKLSRKKTSYSVHSAALEQMVLQIADKISLRNKTSPESVVSDSLEEILSKITEWKRSRKKTSSEYVEDDQGLKEKSIMETLSDDNSDFAESSDSIGKRLSEKRRSSAPERKSRGRSRELSKSTARPRRMDEQTEMKDSKVRKPKDSEKESAKKAKKRISAKQKNKHSIEQGNAKIRKEDWRWDTTEDSEEDSDDTSPEHNRGKRPLRGRSFRPDSFGLPSPMAWNYPPANAVACPPCENAAISFPNAFPGPSSFCPRYGRRCNL